MSNYISDNPQIIVNGFIHTGIAGALDCQETDDLEVLNDDQEELESDDYKCIAAMSPIMHKLESLIIIIIVNFLIYNYIIKPSSNTTTDN